MRIKRINDYHSLTDSGYVIEHKDNAKKKAGLIHKGAAAVGGKYRLRAGQYLHREVWKAFNGPIPKGMSVHHIDGDGHNNSLSNLKCVSHAENLRGHNKSTRGDTTSRYRGVCFVNQSQRWIGSVKKNYKTHRTGNYKSELTAAVMRDCLARDLGFPLDSMNFNGKAG